MWFLRFAAGLAAVVLAHLAGVALVPEFPRFVDLFAVLAVGNGLAGGPLAGLVGGALCGFAHDALAGSPYGLHGFADTFIGYSAARLGQRLIIQRPMAVMATVAGATLVQQAILFGLTVALIKDRQPPMPLWWVVTALANGLVALAFYASTESLRGARERRRLDRVDRIRLSR